MKRNYLHLNVLLIGIGLIMLTGLQGCSDRCEESRRWVYYEPIYTSLEEIRSSINQTDIERDIKNPGRLYYLNGYMLINQPGEGIHIIDDRDVSNPVYKYFLEIPGNFDMAGQGNHLYVDSYIDLVVLDVSNIVNIQEVNRVENFFPEYNSFGYYFDAERGLVTGWEEVEQFETFESDCEGYYYSGGWWPYNRGIAVDFAMAESSFNPSASVAPPSSPGIGGSLAKFTISNNHLYMIDQSDLHCVSIENPDQPVILNKTNLGWGIETIFPYENHIYVGSQWGMHIINIDSPGNPDHISTFSHVFACDPVVVQGDYAYVTLRDGAPCRNGENELNVIDISNKSNPTLLSEFNLYNPGGLGVDGDLLFICDGIAGLKVFNAADKMSITDNVVKFYPDLEAIDVIPFNNVLMVIATDGFYQYDYSDPENIQLLSEIPLTYE